jgi:hypothetical protein
MGNDYKGEASPVSTFATRTPSALLKLGNSLSFQLRASFCLTDSFCDCCAVHAPPHNTSTNGVPFPSRRIESKARPLIGCMRATTLYTEKVLTRNAQQVRQGPIEQRGPIDQWSLVLATSRATIMQMNTYCSCIIVVMNRSYRHGIYRPLFGVRLALCER